MISLVPSASDNSLHDEAAFDTIALNDEGNGVGENILAGPTPSAPAGAASRTDVEGDTNMLAEERSRDIGSGHHGCSGLIHLAGLPPLPALLREWSHAGSASEQKDDDNKNDDQPKKNKSTPPRAQRTSSGTPIAVAVQNDHTSDIADDLDGTIPPPPPQENNRSNRQAGASPLWSMLQSSVTAATTTATSGTAATSNAAAVLPAAALDSPPVKVRHIIHTCTLACTEGCWISFYNILYCLYPRIFGHVFCFYSASHLDETAMNLLLYYSWLN